MDLFKTACIYAVASLIRQINQNMFLWNIKLIIINK